MTGPWPAEVATLVAQPHRTTCRVVLHLVHDVDLDVTNLSIGWDEARAPRCTATVTCPLPDESLLTALDPRHLVRVSIIVGYHLGSGELDEQTVATLDLRAVEESQPDGVLRLDLAGLECRVMDHSLAFLYTSPTPVPVISVIALNVITSSTGDTPFEVRGVTDRLDPFPDAPYGAERWTYADGLADSLGCDLYDDGSGVIVLEPRRTTVTTAVHQLRTGPGGTVTRYRSRRSREGFNNWAHLRYDNGTGDPATWDYANAEATGEFSYTNVGMVMFAETRQAVLTPAARQAAADAVLARQLTGGRSYSCDAIAAWWVRPGDTVTVETARDGQERHLVARADFLWPDDVMSITTRYPEA